MNNFKQAFSAFWSARNQREQRMLIAAAAVVVLGLLYLLLVDPALSGRADLEKRLPALRQQAAEVQALAKEAAALGGTDASSAAPPLTRDGIEASLSRRGLKAQAVTLSGDLAKVQLSGVSFAATVDWLQEMQKSQRLAVLTATVEAQDRPDTVNASFDLRRE